MNKKTTSKLALLGFITVLLAFGVFAFGARGRTSKQEKKARVKFQLRKPQILERIDRNLGGKEPDNDVKKKENSERLNSKGSKKPSKIKKMKPPSFQFNPIPASEVEKTKKKGSRSRSDYSNKKTKAEFSVDAKRPSQAPIRH